MTNNDENYFRFLCIVDYLVSKKGYELDSAIDEAQVPIKFQGRIKDDLIVTLPKDSDDYEELRPTGFIEEKKKDYIPIELGNSEDKSSYYDSLESYLINEKRRSKKVVESLREASGSLIQRLPDPRKNSRFKVRGLVLGHIQSGKTANMAALIARAADNGYRLIIVLAGLTRDLRKQTQDRLDQEITGKSDEPGLEPLVCHPNFAPKWSRLTRSGLDGDFDSGSIGWNADPKTPHLAVIKKNSKIENLIDYLIGSREDLDDFPVLIIDDEADQASINTAYGQTNEKDEPLSPSPTNMKIRKLLDVFSKSVYVGYTATPFANVLIDANDEDDFYPRDFIAVLEEPEGYLGPRQLFGLGLSPSELSPENCMPARYGAVRHLTPQQVDSLNNLREGSKCPPILTGSIICFVLGGCVRQLRGHRQAHMTMLIHPSHLKEKHSLYANFVEAEIERLRGVARNSKKEKQQSVLKLAKDIWESDFMHNPDCQIEGKTFSFDDIWEFARAFLDDLELIVLNSDSDDVLDYNSITPRRYIVIGGNRLSRGLTLEGLMVSLFTRNSGAFDTLLQMGRWFGFRQGYEDLMRIFVEECVERHFCDLARVEVEMREWFWKYSQDDNPPTPLELMPKIRSHSTLSVTSPLKQGAGKTIDISLSGNITQTTVFPLDKREQLKENQVIVDQWLNELGPHSDRSIGEGSFVWEGVSVESILALIDSYYFSEKASRVTRKVLHDYISRQKEEGELARWDVVLPSGAKSRDPYTWKSGVVTHKVGRGLRTNFENELRAIRVLTEPAHIECWRAEFGRGLDDPLYGGLFLYAIDKHSGSLDRKLFPDAKFGEDVIGLAFVFPESTSNATIEYITQAENPD